MSKLLCNVLKMSGVANPPNDPPGCAPGSGYGSYRPRSALYTVKYVMKWYTSTN